MSGGQHVCLVFGISSATASSSVLGRLRQLLLSPLIGQRERESEREGKREEWETMDSGIAFLGRGGSKDQDFCWVSIDCPFTDLSKGVRLYYSIIYPGLLLTVGVVRWNKLELSVNNQPLFIETQKCRFCSNWETDYWGISLVQSFYLTQFFREWGFWWRGFSYGRDFFS